MTTRALVLGGGGTAGIAWETGILAGLAESGVDLTTADLFVGTSAGSAVAAQLTSGLTVDQLLARQADPDQQTAELTPSVDVAALLDRMGSLFATASDQADLRRRSGELAVASATVPEAARLEVIRDRLPSHEWPDRDVLRIVAVDTATGDPVVFDRESGVSLVDAVAASCAVPGVWPAVTIDGRRYMDGGVRSAENADLARGYDRVVVLQVMDAAAGPGWGVALAEQVSTLEAAGSAVAVIRADEASAAAISDNPLDPTTRRPSAFAGVAQGRAEAPRLKDFWIS